MEGHLIGVVPCFARGNRLLELHLHLGVAFRGRSLASRLIRRAAIALSGEGFKCYVWGPVAHQKAKTVYLHAGFREVAILPGLWDLGNGQRCDIGVAVWGGE